MNLAYKKILGRFTKVLRIGKTLPPHVGKNSQLMSFFFESVPYSYLPKHTKHPKFFSSDNDLIQHLIKHANLSDVNIGGCDGGTIWAIGEGNTLWRLSSTCKRFSRDKHQHFFYFLTNINMYQQEAETVHCGVKPAGAKTKVVWILELNI